MEQWICESENHTKKTFDTPSEQTKPTVTLFVLLLKYAHIHVIMTRLACRAMARVPVHSPLSLKSRGGSHIFNKISTVK